MHASVSFTRFTVLLGLIALLAGAGFAGYASACILNGPPPALEFKTLDGYYQRWGHGLFLYALAGTGIMAVALGGFFLRKQLTSLRRTAGDSGHADLPFIQEIFRGFGLLACGIGLAIYGFQLLKKPVPADKASWAFVFGAVFFIFGASYIGQNLRKLGTKNS